MARTIPALFRHVLFALPLLGCAGQAVAQEYYYAIEVNGVLCGYSRFVDVAAADGRARRSPSLTHETVVRGTLLGAPVDSRITLTYHIDPATRAFTYHDSTIEQGPARLTLRRPHRGRQGPRVGRPRRARVGRRSARRRRPRQHPHASAPGGRLRGRPRRNEDVPGVRRPRQRGPRNGVHEGRNRAADARRPDLRDGRARLGRSRHRRQRQAVARHADRHRRADPQPGQQAVVPGRARRWWTPSCVQHAGPASIPPSWRRPTWPFPTSGGSRT